MEDELIRRAQRGDAAAFRALVDCFAPGAWRVARVLIPDREQAEDALQEAWVDIWRGLPQFDSTRPFRPWLLTVVGNRCRMFRRRRVMPTQALDESIAETLQDPHDASSEMLAHEPDPALHTALERLSATERELLALRYHAELELAEIAALYGEPLSTIKSRLYRTLALLRGYLTVASATSDTSETIA